MTTTDRTDILAILQERHDMIGADKKRTRQLIEAVAAIVAEDREPTPFSRVISVVEDVTGFTLAQLQRHDRNGAVKDARHIMAYSIRMFCHATMKDIGRVINRDHSSVIHSVHTVNKQPRVFEGRILEIQTRLNPPSASDKNQTP